MPTSLLFIPDITGFTQFVNGTEVAHGQHVISELLELIIDADQLGMTVSEIEGDAVLFYRDGTPSMAELVEQSRVMFEAFHSHLRKYETQRLCECGACRTAQHLSLKIVAHAGDVEFISVRGFRKPYGSDVILAHQLLKNDLTGGEYLLMTQPLAEEADAGLPDWAEPASGATDYEDFGTIEYTYVPLAGLKAGIPASPRPRVYEKSPNPIVHSVYVDRPLEDVFELVTNFDLRLSWNKGVDELEYEHDRVNRVGTRHHCVIGDKLIEFETVTNDFGGGRRTYGEHVLDAPLVDDVVLYWIMEAEGDGTTVTIEGHYKPRGFPLSLLAPLFRRSFGRQLPKSLMALKAAAERSGAQAGELTAAS